MATTATQLSLTKDKDFPELYSTANKGAIRSQAAYFRLVRIELIAISLAALAQVVGRQWAPTIANLLRLNVHGEFQILGNDFSGSQISSAVGTYALPALVMLVAVIMLGLRVWLRYDRRWRARRAVAEATKGLAWRFSMHAMHSEMDASMPFTPAQANEAFARDLAQLIEQSESLRLAAPGPDAVQITPEMDGLRAASIETQRAAYLKDRLDDQQQWYDRKSTKFQTLATQLQVARFVAYILGFLLIFFHGVGVNGLGIMTTVAGAFATWLAGKHYDDLSQSYAGMARQLSLLRALAPMAPPPGAPATGSGDWTRFVDKVETLMDGEHQDWRRLS